METLVPALEIESLVQRILNERRIPTTTYRLQFNANFTFRDALEILPYLQALGISDYYTSPLFQPRSGSTHGYDVVDYNTLNPTLGSKADFDALTAALQQHGLGLLLDLVPNHMGNGADNQWWLDVLKNGPTSPYADFFDIDWHPPKRELENKVLLPVLGEHYGRVLENGELRLTCETGEFSLDYGALCLPVIVNTWPPILSLCRDELLVAGIAENHAALLELESILTAIRHLPHYANTAPDQIQTRFREQQIIQQRFMVLYHAYPAVGQALQQALKILNGNPGDKCSFDRLDEIINGQPYRLEFWRVAADEINYRRFFDINDMAAIRVEFPQVFSAVHQLTFELLKQGQVTGLRIDHPDGLWDPPHYFLQLQEGYVTARAAHHAPTQEAALEAAERLKGVFRQTDFIQTEWPLYVIVEKILSEIEPLPADWAAYGTTGYDFMIAANGIFVNRDHVHAFDDLYSRFIGQHLNFRELVYRSKRLIMQHALASELNARSHQLARLVERNRCLRGFTLNSLTFGLGEIIACMSIYRTYITAPGSISERDRMYLDEAVAEAIQRNPRFSRAVFDFLHQTLLLENLYDFEEADRSHLIEFVMQFQQITGPVMAKSVEDTTFYIYNRLVSLNEVGGNPEQFGIGIDDFHKHNLWHREHWPHTMLALSTHDTKRGEDTRARINVLSEIPAEWETAIWRWAQINTPAKTDVNGQLAPDRNDEYLIYQTLIGTWPVDGDITPEYINRITQYMGKATNEAKVHTSWTTANEQYDHAIKTFIERILADPNFTNDFEGFQRRTAYYGVFNSLAQTLLKLTSPGVPDTYQGTELWTLTLVDPDNRQPVDYSRRQQLLAEFQDPIKAGAPPLTSQFLQNVFDDRIKFYLVYSALNFRQQHPALFADGNYQPLTADGDKAVHVCAFQRTYENETVIVVAPTLVIGLTNDQECPPIGAEVWGNTHLRLPQDQIGHQYRNLLTGETIIVKADTSTPGLPLSAILGHFPVALLTSVT